MSVTTLTIQERLHQLALQLSEASFSTETQALTEINRTLSEAAQEVERIAIELEAFVLHDDGHRFPTPKQSLTLGYFLHSRWNGEDPGRRGATVTRGGAGLGEDYLYVRFPDGYEGGIDREGRLST